MIIMINSQRRNGQELLSKKLQQLKIRDRVVYDNFIESYVYSVKAGTNKGLTVNELNKYIKANTNLCIDCYHELELNCVIGNSNLLAKCSNCSKEEIWFRQ